MEMKNRRAGLGFLPLRHAILDCDPFLASGRSGMSAELSGARIEAEGWKSGRIGGELYGDCDGKFAVPARSAGVAPTFFR